MGSISEEIINSALHDEIQELLIENEELRKENKLLKQGFATMVQTLNAVLHLGPEFLEDVNALVAGATREPK